MNKIKVTGMCTLAEQFDAGRINMRFAEERTGVEFERCRW
jgi:hypothetical protein